MYHQGFEIMSINTNIIQDSEDRSPIDLILRIRRLGGVRAGEKFVVVIPYSESTVELQRQLRNLREFCYEMEVQMNYWKNKVRPSRISTWTTQDGSVSSAQPQAGDPSELKLQLLTKRKEFQARRQRELEEIKETNPEAFDILRKQYPHLFGGVDVTIEEYLFATG